MLTATKPPKCKHCKERTDSLGRLLHDECVQPWLDAQKARETREAKNAEFRQKKADRAKLLKFRADHLSLSHRAGLAQSAFNQVIRARDAEQPCISCGKPPAEMTYQGGRDAGHYRSVGAAKHLRFNEDNVHAQCVRCNQWGAGMVVEYRIGLIDRIGQARLEALETNNAVRKWTKEELIAIRALYKAKKKALESTRIDEEIA